MIPSARSTVSPVAISIFTGTNSVTNCIDNLITDIYKSISLKNSFSYRFCTIFRICETLKRRKFAIFPIGKVQRERKNNKACAINDPLGQIHSLTSSNLYFHSEFVLFCDKLFYTSS